MPITLEIAFAGLTTAPETTAVLLTGEDLAFGAIGAALDKAAKAGLTAAARAADFKGKEKACIELLAPAGLDIQRLLLLGAGRADGGGCPGLAGAGRHRLWPDRGAAHQICLPDRRRRDRW